MVMSRRQQKAMFAKLKLSKDKFGASDRAFIVGKNSVVAVTQRRDDGTTLITITKGPKTKVQVVKK